MNDTPAQRRKRGRQPLSPNGVDRELAQQTAAGHAAQRRAKTSRGHTEWLKREADWLRRLRGKRLRQLGLKALPGAIVRWRVKAVRYYQQCRRRGTEAVAASHSAHRFRVSAATIRRWDRVYRTVGLTGLRPKPPGPHTVTTQVPLATQWLVVALRRLQGWNEKRLAVELARRGLAQISHTSVGRIFARFHLPTRTYHSLAKCDGIVKRRYEKAMPNAQWHIDFLETTLADGQRITLLCLLDDHSRFCLACHPVPDMTAHTALQSVQQACARYGRPQELVSDNGRAFTSVYVGVPTPFGEWLRDAGIRHCLITPYYPEGNGKAEAFVKILKHECLGWRFTSQLELERALTEFVTYYNYYRLHGSLHYQPPATRYCGSPSPQQHGLLGIPALPDDLRRAYPPAPGSLPVITDYQLIKRRHALVSLTC